MGPPVPPMPNIAAGTMRALRPGPRLQAAACFPLPEIRALHAALTTHEALHCAAAHDEVDACGWP